MALQVQSPPRPATANAASYSRQPSVNGMAAHTHYSPPESAVEKVKRHNKYYISGGDVHFLVSPLIATYYSHCDLAAIIDGVLTDQNSS